jgi:uncharacterized caspase-like protein
VNFQASIHRLTDDTQDPTWMPTRANIMRELEWLVWDAVPGDSLFFMFSGHGGQEEDQNGDEDDGFDETILPSDWRKGTMSPRAGKVYFSMFNLCVASFSRTDFG